MSKPGNKFELLRRTESGIQIAIKVQPRASRTAIDTVRNGQLKVFVTAPPVDFASNSAVIALFAKTLDCPKGAVRIVRGTASRTKTIELIGANEEVCRAKLFDDD